MDWVRQEGKLYEVGCYTVLIRFLFDALAFPFSMYR
jgi:hypothetical protein